MYRLFTSFRVRRVNPVKFEEPVIGLGPDSEGKGSVASKHQLVEDYCRSLDEPKAGRNQLALVSDKG